MQAVNLNHANYAALSGIPTGLNTKAEELPFHPFGFLKSGSRRLPFRFMVGGFDLGRLI